MRVPRWREPGNHAGQDGDADRRAEHSPVKAEVDPERHPEREALDPVLHRRGRRNREQHRSRAAEHREHDALGEQLTDDASAAGAERRAQGHLAAPRRGPCQQHVGHVGARDEQQQSGQRREHRRGDVEHRAVLRHRPRLRFGHHEQLDALVRRRVLRGEHVDLDGERRARLFDADAAREATDHGERMAIPIFEPRRALGGVVRDAVQDRHRHEARHLEQRLEACEGLGGDADNRERLSVQPDALSHDRWIGVELDAPVVVREHQDR